MDDDTAETVFTETTSEVLSRSFLYSICNKPERNKTRTETFYTANKLYYSSAVKLTGYKLDDPRFDSRNGHQGMYGISCQ